jgi:hypothetical protein
MSFVEHHPALYELECAVIAVLKLAMSYGTVHVITNAETGWVQLSAAKFLPGVVPWLEKVNVISARSTYEGMFPDSPLKWKFYAFQERLSNVLCDSQRHVEKNVISFGDSHVEREAVRAVTRGVQNTRTKSVKFAERPSMEQLRRQIELVTNCMQYIFSHEGDLDLQLTVTVNPAPNEKSNAVSTAAPNSNANSNSASPTVTLPLSLPLSTKSLSAIPSNGSSNVVVPISKVNSTSYRDTIVNVPATLNDANSKAISSNMVGGPTSTLISTSFVSHAKGGYANQPYLEEKSYI